MKITCFTLLALLLPSAALAHTADDKAKLQSCIEMQNKATDKEELDCYREAAKAPPLSSVTLGGRTLADEWTPVVGAPLTLYKQTYFLVANTTQPNNAPTSPNPQNQVPFSYLLDHRDLKFQISIKSDIVTFRNRHTFWAGYTQRSFWQAFDKKNSSPFRESNYEPELIYSYLPDNMVFAGFTASYLNAAVVHQSNGQSLPRSRSWNRLYAQAGLEHDFGGDCGRLAIIPRLWGRMGGGNVDDDNPDILKYMGHGDLELRYYRGHGLLSAVMRTRAIELDLSIPLRLFGVQNADFHLQYFHGYGESLIDYNQKHSTYGIGLSMPFGGSY